MDHQAQRPMQPAHAKRIQQMLALSYLYFQPSFEVEAGLDLRKPALFVGNHTLFGALDSPFLVHFLAQQHQLEVYTLGDRLHFLVPGWHSLVKQYGGVLADPEVCRTLMQQQKSIVVFPGGAREIMRRRDERYQLTWKNRTGFARLAIEQGYDIIPFASIGPDDCFDIVFDPDEIQNLPGIKQLLKPAWLQRYLRHGDVIPPVARGLAGLPIPKPERFYFKFGPRIATAGLPETDDAAWTVREEVASHIERHIEALLAKRAKERETRWSWLRRRLTTSRA